MYNCTQNIGVSFFQNLPVLSFHRKSRTNSYVVIPNRSVLIHLLIWAHHWHYQYCTYSRNCGSTSRGRRSAIQVRLCCVSSVLWSRPQLKITIRSLYTSSCQLYSGNTGTKSTINQSTQLQKKGVCGTKWNQNTSQAGTMQPAGFGKREAGSTTQAKSRQSVIVPHLSEAATSNLGARSVDIRMPFPTKKCAKDMYRTVSAYPSHSFANTLLMARFSMLRKCPSTDSPMSQSPMLTYPSAVKSSIQLQQIRGATLISCIQRVQAHNIFNGNYRSNPPQHQKKTLLGGIDGCAYCRQVRGSLAAECLRIVPPVWRRPHTPNALIPSSRCMSHRATRTARSLALELLVSVLSISYDTLYVDHTIILIL